MSVCRSIGRSVGPLVMLLSAGRDEPANDLFRVYELVLKIFYVRNQDLNILSQLTVISIVFTSSTSLFIGNKCLSSK